jgi:hypothetical protein
MTNWMIPLGALVLLAGFLVWIYRGNGEGALVLEPALQRWDRLRDWWEQRRDRPRGDGPLGTGKQDPDDIPAPQPAARALPAPPPASLNGAPPAAEPGMGYGPAQSDLMHAIGSLVARASGGDIRDVRRTIKTLATAADALGDGVSHLGTRLAEPDKLYGSEIWEPLTMAGAQLRSGALHMNQSDSMVTSLLSTSVGELAETPRQAPHHSQLNGPA